MLAGQLSLFLSSYSNQQLDTIFKIEQEETNISRDAINHFSTFMQQNRASVSQHYIREIADDLVKATHTQQRSAFPIFRWPKHEWSNADKQTSKPSRQFSLAKKSRTRRSSSTEEARIIFSKLLSVRMITSEENV